MAVGFLVVDKERLLLVGGKVRLGHHEATVLHFA